MNTHSFIVFLMLLTIVPAAAVSATAPSHVAMLTVEDAAGSMKTQLERTTPNNCDSKLKAIRKAATSMAGIKQITNARCVEVSEYSGYFERKNMPLPYVISGKNSVLLLRGASKKECKRQALLMRQSNNDVACIFPVRASR